MDLILLSEDTKKLIKNSACDSAKDLFDVLNETPQQELNSSLISKTILAVLLNVVIGRRVKPTSPYITHLHQILINKSILKNHIFNYNQWTENFDITSCAAQYYSKLIMILSDLDEDKDCTLVESSSQNVFNFLTPNHYMQSLPGKFSVVADILVYANIGIYLASMDEILNTLNVVQCSAENSVEPSSKEVCFEQCKSLIYNLSKRLPLLNIGRRLEVLKSFCINGFTIPQGSIVQTVLLSHDDSHSISEEKILYEDFTMSVLSLVLSEIMFYCKSGNVRRDNKTNNEVF